MQGSLAGAELMDEPFLDSLSSHSGVLDAAEPTEEWLSTSSDWLASSDGELPLSSVPGHAEPSAEACAATELGQDFQDASVTFEQAVGSIDNLGFHEARMHRWNPCLSCLWRRMLQHALTAWMPTWRQHSSLSGHAARQCRRDSSPAGMHQRKTSLGNSRLWRSVSDPFSKTKQLPTLAPGMEGAPMETPFAGDQRCPACSSAQQSCLHRARLRLFKGAQTRCYAHSHVAE